jgi:uncharacterized damage-inducible protein DinB
MTHGGNLADELKRALHGEAWHGPALDELLANLSVEEAMQRPIPNAHNSWELVLHLASWANIALRRIEGGQTEPHDGEDWPSIGGFTQEHWNEARSALRESYERLASKVLTMSDEQLAQSAPQSKRSIEGMVNGVVQHAAYHGGQIAILSKAVTTHHRRTAL